MKMTLIVLAVFVLCAAKVPKGISIVAHNEQCGDSWLAQFDLNGDIVKGDEKLWGWLAIPKLTALDTKMMGDQRMIFAIESFPPISPCTFAKVGLLRVRRNVFTIFVNQQVFYQKEWFGGALTRVIWVEGILYAFYRNYDDTIQRETLYAFP